MTTTERGSGAAWPDGDTDPVAAPSSWWPDETSAPFAPDPPDPGAAAAPDSNGRSHPGRLALGMAVLAAERLRAGAPASDVLVLGVGLAQQTADEVREVARRYVGPPARMAYRTLGWAAQRAAANTTLGRSRDRLSRLVAGARRRGEDVVAAGRADADALIRASVSDGISWAQAQAVPQVVDGLVPHLVDSVVPRLIDGALPEIRARVLPVVIDDLTNDPRLRELVMEQSRGVVDEAAQHVRSATAHADDRVEMAFRRLVGSSEPDPAADDPAPARDR